MHPKINEPLVWKQAVEMWLHHITDNYVETTLLVALKRCHNEIEPTIDYLTTLGYSSLLGQWGYGGPNDIHIDVGGNLKAHDLINVYFPTWNDKVMSISLSDILIYLKNDKKEVSVQLSLL